MHVIHARNVNDAYRQGMRYIKELGPEHLTTSRVGDVYRAPVPVTTVYAKPAERVLFDVVRDANPFFHYLEGLWMLAGRRDVAFVAKLVKRMETFSDDGLTFNAAYGHRWREYFGYDQLAAAVNKLRRNWLDRRVVVGMWNPSRDLVDDSLDIPCNLGVKFAGRFAKNGDKVLDMVVFNRSNDIILGAYGANAVHMSMMHEYVATCAGGVMGTYTQISGDYHAYTDSFDKCWHGALETINYPCQYSDSMNNPSSVHTIPLVDDIDSFDTELRVFMDEGTNFPRMDNAKFANRSIRDGYIMLSAYSMHKAKQPDSAYAFTQMLEASDWRLACLRWLDRRTA